MKRKYVLMLGIAFSLLFLGGCAEIEPEITSFFEKLGDEDEPADMRYQKLSAVFDKMGDMLGLAIAMLEPEDLEGNHEVEYYPAVAEYAVDMETEGETYASKGTDASGDGADEVVVEDSVESAEAADSEEQEEKEEEPATVYYVTDMQQQSQYVNMFKEQELNAVILSHPIDQPFISQLEQGDLKVKFQRIDAGLNETMTEEADEETLKAQTETLSEIFKKALGKETLEVKVEKLKNENISSMVTLPEETRRMQDMMKMYSAGGAGMDSDMFGGGETLVLNSSNKLVQYILDNKEGEHTDLFCKQLYDLAIIANKPLKAAEMTEFIARSNEIMMLLAE